MSKHPNATGRILDAAERLFAEKGFEGTSINAIATASHASKANVFHHFGSKEGLYQAMLGRLARDRLELLKAICPGDKQARETHEESSAGLERFLRVIYNDMLEHPAREQLFMRELLDADGERINLLAASIEEGLMYETGQIREAQQAGVMRDDIDPMMVPLLIHGVHMLHRLLRPLMLNLPTTAGILEPDDYLRMLTQVLYSGLRVQHDKESAR